MSSLSTNNEVCLAWLATALQRLRGEGRTKAVSYLEAVAEEVAFETEATPPRRSPSVATHRTEGDQTTWEEGASSGCWLAWY